MELDNSKESPQEQGIDEVDLRELEKLLEPRTRYTSITLESLSNISEKSDQTFFDTNEAPEFIAMNRSPREKQLIRERIHEVV